MNISGFVPLSAVYKDPGDVEGIDLPLKLTINHNFQPFLGVG